MVRHSMDSSGRVDLAGSESLLTGLLSVGSAVGMRLGSQAMWDMGCDFITDRTDQSEHKVIMKGKYQIP